MIELLPIKVPIVRCTWSPILQSWSTIAPILTIEFSPTIAAVLITAFASTTVPGPIAALEARIAFGWMTEPGLNNPTARLNIRSRTLLLPMPTIKKSALPFNSSIFFWLSKRI